MNPLFYITAVVTLLCTPLAFAQKGSDKFCDDASVKASQNAARIPAYQSGYKIIGQGKAYFYSAPLEVCKQKSVFLVPNDSVDAYADYDVFTSVMYIHPVSGTMTEGWIKTERLESTGVGMGPNVNADGVQQ